jgi:hypothetical protein
MKIEYTPVRELRAHSNNARTHLQEQARQTANCRSDSDPAAKTGLDKYLRHLTLVRSGRR